MRESDMQVDSDDVCEVCDDQPRSAASQSASSVEVTDAQLRAAYETILRAIGEDPNREGLRKTPARAAKAMRALCSGYAIQPTQLARDALFTVEARSKEPLGMVVVVSKPLLASSALPTVASIPFRSLTSPRVASCVSAARHPDQLVV